MLSARNQWRIESRCGHKVLAAFFMGSILERIVLVHHTSRYFAAQAAWRYTQYR